MTHISVAWDWAIYEALLLCTHIVPSYTNVMKSHECGQKCAADGRSMVFRKSQIYTCEVLHDILQFSYKESVNGFRATHSFLYCSIAVYWGETLVVCSWLTVNHFYCTVHDFYFYFYFLKQTKHLNLPGKELICVTRLGDGLCVINTK